MPSLEAHRPANPYRATRRRTREHHCPSFTPRQPLSQLEVHGIARPNPETSNFRGQANVLSIATWPSLKYGMASDVCAYSSEAIESNDAERSIPLRTDFASL